MSRTIVFVIAVVALVAASAAGAGAGVVTAPPAPAAGPATPEVSRQHPGLLNPGTGPENVPGKPHTTGKLDCSGCHQRQHLGVVKMYLGMGGRGTPMIPSHMFQVRVECVACHIAPKEGAAAADIVGQTFRPSEQACVGCHGEKYRGMIARWSGTLTKMREMLAPKLAAARAALDVGDAKTATRARARTLVEDSEFNIRFVELARGVHNVFYAADLLKLSNSWLDQAMIEVGKKPLSTDDALVRGGYCAVLCHEQAGVKLPATVRFGTQALPHARHFTEFGAVCTQCHSAEVHKRFTATRATCQSCHHAAQNERCESCHRAQSAFYRGRVKTTLVKVEPNMMANAVGCTGCHEGADKRAPRRTVGAKCVACHDKGYASMLGDWTTGFDTSIAAADGAIRRAAIVVARARRAGHNHTEADALLKDARDAIALVRTARGVHNPSAAEALIDAATAKARAAEAKVR